MDKETAKKEIKTKINDAAFKSLKLKQKTKEKVKHIVYEKLEIQNYLKTSLLTNKEAEVLTALRSRTVRGVKDNYHTFYKTNLQCDFCNEKSLDTQEHCMTCPTLIKSIVEAGGIPNFLLNKYMNPGFSTLL